MTTPIRNTDPTLFHFVTLRTHEAALWMVPLPCVEAIIGGVLARYQEIFSIEIFVYSFVSNHYHLLLRAPLGNLDEFEENVNREIARRINKINGRKARFWARRYDDLIIPNEEDLLEAFLYILTNSTKHGLVSHPREWPGINCYKHLTSNSPQTYTFTHYSKLDEKGVTVKTTHQLKLSPLPQHSTLDASNRLATIRRLVEERCEALKSLRSEKGRGFLGSAAVKAQKLGSLPREVAQKHRPICYTKSPVTRRNFANKERLRRTRYAEASRQFRLGIMAILFPPHCHRPPLHRAPRNIPFQPLALQKMVA